MTTQAYIAASNNGPITAPITGRSARSRENTSPADATCLDPLDPRPPSARECHGDLGNQLGLTFLRRAAKTVASCPRDADPVRVSLEDYAARYR